MWNYHTFPAIDNDTYLAKGTAADYFLRITAVEQTTLASKGRWIDLDLSPLVGFNIGTFFELH